MTNFYQNINGTIWIGTSKGLGRFDTPFREIKYYPHSRSSLYIADSDFNPVLEDQYGFVWKGVYGNGLLIFDSRTEIYTEHRYDKFNPIGLLGDNILSIYEDNSGILWLGKLWYGLDKCDRKKLKFNYIDYNPRDPNSLSGNDVYSICEDSEGIIWLGIIHGGINRYDPKTNRITHYRHNPSNPNSLSDDDVWCIINDPNEAGILWAGTRKGGLNRFDTRREIFTHYLNDPYNANSISHNRIMSLLIDHEGTFWIGTWGGGLNRFDRETKKFTSFKNDPQNRTSLSGDRVAYIYEDHSGKLWIGTDLNGLDCFDRKTEKFTAYKSLLRGESYSSISYIHEDRNENFWLGTRYTGLHLFDRNKGISINNYNDQNGLADNWVMAILDDDAGNLWISTTDGLSKFNPQTGSFKNYGISDGLEGAIFSPRSALKSKNGEMFFGGEFGFDFFHPDEVNDDPIPPKVIISNISFFNRPGEKIKFDGFVSELNKINLSYNENDLRFDFVGLHFSEPARNTYKYVLEGFDEDWVDAGTQRNAVYTNLDPGEYVFKVTAANRDGVWNEQGASIRLIIFPPWWATMWAYLLYGLLILGVIYFTWKLQLKRIRINNEFEMSKFEAEKMHEVDEMKNRFFANISHEFRTPLTLIFGPPKIATIGEEDKFAVIKRNANRLYSLVNQLLDLSKLESGKMKLEAAEQNIIPFLKGIFLSFTSLAERRKILLRFDAQEDNLSVYIDKDKVEKIINNILSNAFKFTPEGGKINFKVEKLTDNVEIRITDNGIGIPKERIDNIFDRFYQVDSSHTRQGEGTGIGLALTKELVELHKGKIKLKSKEGEGTTVSVELPMGRNHLKPEEIVEKQREEIVSETEVLPGPIRDTENRKEKTDIKVLLDTNKPLLLIVEDNPDVRNYIISHLEKDYRIQEAVDGEDGLNQAIKHMPDLIISDVMMPKIDGFELCNKLKTDERTSHIPIIMLTAKATSKDKIEGYETGADDYIMKPFDTKELKIRISNLIEQRKRLREHFSEESLFVFDDKNITKTDKEFLKRAVEIITKHLSETAFGVDSFAEEIALSRSQLHRKLIALVGEPPGDLIRRVRLTASAKLINDNFGNISEIAAEVGFSNPSNFAQCFRKQFGVSPSEYQNHTNN